MSRILMLLLWATPLAAAPVPKVKAKPTLQGAWEAVERQYDGKPQRVGTEREFRVFEDTNVTVYYGPDEKALTDFKPDLMKLELPEAEDSTAINVIQSHGQGRSTTAYGRIAFEGETLRVAFKSSNHQQRPVEAKPAAGVAFIMFKRVDAAKLIAK